MARPKENKKALGKCLTLGALEGDAMFSVAVKSLGNLEDFPGGAVVKNPPVNVGDMGSIPDLGRSHMPWGN